MPITTVERESPQSNEGREKHENTKTRKHDQKTRSNVAQAEKPQSVSLRVQRFLRCT